MKWIKFVFYFTMTLLSISFACVAGLICYIGVVGIIDFFKINCPELALFILLVISGIIGIIVGVGGFFRSLELFCKTKK